MTTHPISIESAGGEYMESVLIISWSAKAGDRVRAGDLLVTVETAKAATEVEAERDGWLAEIHYSEGEEAPVGAILGTISDREPEAAAKADSASPVAVAAPAAQVSIPTTSAGISGNGATRVIASPLARRLASQAGIDLSSVSGSGPNGRVKQRDILTLLHRREPTLSEAPRNAPPISAAIAAVTATAPERTGLPIVLLHGFGADRSAWRQVLPLLATDRFTISIDLPAHGTSAGERAESIEDLAAFVSDRLEAQGIEQAHVVGHSLGGATALRLTSIGRIAVRSLTLFAPGGLGPEIAGGFITGLTGSASAPALERWLAFMLADAATLPQGYAAAVLRQMEKVGNRTALEALAGRLFSGDTQLFDAVPALLRLDIPTRIVWGRADRIIPCSHALRAPDFAAVHLLSGVGHVPQMEAPGLTARLIMETVRSAGE